MNEADEPSDVDGLMQRALHATSRDEIESAIGHLKGVLEIDPGHAKATYLIGALHAQIGLFDRASEEMRRAVEIDPGMSPAHLHLGVMHVRAGRYEEARAAWEPLDTLGQDDPVFLFKQALIHFMEGRLARCILDIDSGIARNSANPSLNDDMSGIRSVADHLLHAQDQADVPGMIHTPARQGARHFLMSRFQGARDEGEGG